MYSNRLSRLVLFCTVFLTGAAVLILEVAAVRLLTPTFGASLYVLSSVLSIILFALSLGYFIGGKMVDRFPTHVPLYYIIALSGLIQLLLLFASLQVLTPGETYGAPLVAPLVTSFIFFFLPALLLGMDSPYVITLLSQNIPPNTRGSYVGTTFFWSTIGSICGSVASGFWLIPTLGVQTTIISVSITMVMVGTIFRWLLPNTKLSKQHFTQQAIIAVGIVATSALTIFLIRTHNDGQLSTLLSYEGLYSHIAVQEVTVRGMPARVLRRDVNHSSAAFAHSTEHVHSYTRFVDLYDTLIDTPEHFLMIGGGAYTVPRRVVFLYPSLTVDVVEIEPSLFSLAQDYFYLDDISHINNFTMDARLFLSHTTSTYDFVFTDAFSTGLNAPFHLTTKEFYEELQSRLSSDGVLLTNYVGILTNEPNSLTSGMYHTMKSVFPYVLVLQSQPKPNTEFQNLMFFASNKPLPDDFLTTKAPHAGIPYVIKDLLVQADFFTTDDPLIFTDDHAPVELLSARQLKQSHQ